MLFDLTRKHGLYGIFAVVVVVGVVVLFGPITILSGPTDGPPDSNEINHTISSDSNEINHKISSCTTIDQPGRYELTGDIANSTGAACIKITASNVILDGQGHTIDGGLDSNGPGYAGVGVRVWPPSTASGKISNVTVTNLTVINWKRGVSYTEVVDGHITETNVSLNTDGIMIRGSTGTLLSNNTVTGNGIHGIQIHSSDSTILVNNTITNNNYWTESYGITLNGSTGTLLSHNTVTGNGDGIQIYSSNSTTLSNNIVMDNDRGAKIVSSDRITLSNNTVTGNGYGIYLNASTGITLSNNTVTDNDDFGIYLGASTGTLLSNNIVIGNANGIWIRSSNRIMVSNNTIMNNDASGIILEASNRTMVSNNTIMNNDGFGIILDASTGTIVSNNTITGNGGFGITLDASTGTMVSNNTITNNYGSGIYLSYSTGTTVTGNVLIGNREGLIIGNNIRKTTIYNNYFNNTDNVRFLPSVEHRSNTNTWNVSPRDGPNIVGGPRIGGNFYATPNGTGFSQTCADQNDDGFCDTPNDFEANGPPIDTLPLALPENPTLPPATNTSAAIDETTTNINDLSIRLL